MLGLREWLFVAFGIVFLTILLWPTDGLVIEGSLKDLLVHELKDVHTVRVSGALLSLKLQEGANKLYTPPTFQVSQSDGVVSVSGTSGSIVLGRGLNSIEVSCGTLEVSGVSTFESSVFSASIVRFNNFIMRKGGNLTVSAAVAQGVIFVEALDGELIVKLSVASQDLTVVVDERSQALVKFVGQVPRVRVGK